MAGVQGNMDERYNPTGIDPTGENGPLSTYNIQNTGKGLDPSGRAAEMRSFNYDMLKMFYQNNYSEYMWNKTNEYNSTKNQLKRWTEAGGNPNAFFGGGTNTGNAGQLTSSAPGNGTPAYGLGMASLESAGKINESFWQTRKIKAEAEKQEIENGTLRQINEATLENIKKNSFKLAKEANLTEAQTKQVIEMLPYLKGKTNAEIEEITQRKNNLVEEGENIKQMRKRLKAETWEDVSSAYIKAWEAWYRKTYGINPEAGWANMIIQFLTGKAAELNPAKVWDDTKLILQNGWEGAKDFWEMAKEYGLEDFEETYQYNPKTNSYERK